MPDEHGAVLVEGLLVFPVITLFTAGILEYGNMLWQRHQLQVGVRDAARYYARCRTTFNSCNKSIAQNIAFYGKPLASGGDVERVPGWNDPSQLLISDAVATATFDVSMITATGTTTYEPSPWFNALGINSIELSYTHEQRYIGW